MRPGLAAQLEAKRVLELAMRDNVAIELTADGWRLTPIDVEQLLAVAPLADELAVVPA